MFQLEKELQIKEEMLLNSDEVPAILKCSLCKLLFCVPVTLHCGHTFCKDCIRGNSRYGEIHNLEHECPRCDFVYHTLPEVNEVLNEIIESEKIGESPRVTEPFAVIEDFKARETIEDSPIYSQEFSPCAFNTPPLRVSESPTMPRTQLPTPPMEDDDEIIEATQFVVENNEEASPIRSDDLFRCTSNVQKKRKRRTMRRGNDKVRRSLF